MISRRTLVLDMTALGVWAAVRGSLAQASEPAKAGPDGGGSAPAGDPFPGGYVVRAPAVPDGAPAFVVVREGRLEGVEADGVRYFRGIPYAAPPLGALRFKPPQAAEKWTGTRRAVENPPAPLQTDFLAEAPTSEDCLYLNVWAPAGPGPFPVYVYIHGGGNTTGYSLEHRVQGASFARDGIVCVNIEYRLGVMGFLELGGLLGADFSGSGNNGIRDQLCALQWVRRNIAAFGGDPRRVTIGGQSAGGFDVCTLVASPLSKGLFRQAISQSGSGHGVSSIEDARAAAARFGAAIVKQGGSLDSLQSLPASIIMAAQQASFQTGQHNGVVDGVVLLERPFEAVRKGRGRDIRLLIGANRDEIVVLMGPPDPHKFNDDQTAAYTRLTALTPDLSEPVRLERFVSGQMLGAPSDIYADNHASSSGISFVYHWTWGAPSGKFRGNAFHGLEMSFVWNNIGALAARYVDPVPALQGRADTVHALWASFIKDGTPKATGVPKWIPWSSAERHYMDIGDDYQLKLWPAAQMAVWHGLLES